MILRDKCITSINVKKWLMDENNRQIKKWGIQTLDAFKWLAFLMEEVGELSRAISEHEWRGGTKEDIKKEAIQAATLAIKIAEMVSD